MIRHGSLTQHVDAAAPAVDPDRLSADFAGSSFVEQRRRITQSRTRSRRGGGSRQPRSQWSETVRPLLSSSAGRESSCSPRTDRGGHWPQPTASVGSIIARLSGPEPLPLSDARRSRRSKRPASRVAPGLAGDFEQVRRVQPLPHEAVVRAGGMRSTPFGGFGTWGRRAQGADHTPACPRTATQREKY